MRYRKEIVVTKDASEVFAYLADFSRAAEWDPGIEEARRLTEGPTTLGSRFELVALFRGNRQRFEYEVTTYEEGRCVKLHGEGAKAVSDDAITVEPSGEGAQVTYEADLHLKGPYRAFEPFIGRMVRRMGDDALAGLKSRLDDIA